MTPPVHPGEPETPQTDGWLDDPDYTPEQFAEMIAGLDRAALMTLLRQQRAMDGVLNERKPKYMKRRHWNADCRWR